MMDFGRKLLSRFGWEEGKGLGKLENGIVAPLKPKLKFDTTGVGFDYSKEFVNDWWAQGYDDALKKVDVSGKTKKRKKKPADNDASKGVDKKRAKTFIKTETMLQDGSSVPEADVEDKPIKVIEPTSLNFEKLFEACGRRTAHKGARHGLGLNGKLARLEAQEKVVKLPFQDSETVPKVKTDLNSSENNESSHKKKKHSKNSRSSENVPLDVDNSCCAPEKFEQVNEERVYRKKKSNKNRDKDLISEDVVNRQEVKVSKRAKIKSEKSLVQSECINSASKQKNKVKKKSKPDEIKEPDAIKMEGPFVYDINAVETNSVNLEVSCDEPKTKKKKKTKK